MWEETQDAICRLDPGCRDWSEWEVNKTIGLLEFREDGVVPGESSSCRKGRSSQPTCSLLRPVEGLTNLQPVGLHQRTKSSLWAW